MPTARARGKAGGRAMWPPPTPVTARPGGLLGTGPPYGRAQRLASRRPADSRGLYWRPRTDHEHDFGARGPADERHALARQRLPALARLLESDQALQPALSTLLHGG